jgi:hypothetical protein
VAAAVLAAVSILAGASCSTNNSAKTTSTTIAHPTYTASEENSYFHDLASSVPSLSSDVHLHGAAVLDALLAYGAGFCTFLQSGQDPSTAVSNLQTQAENLKATTGLTQSQTNYETIATDALLALCRECPPKGVSGLKR